MCAMVNRIEVICGCSKNRVASVERIGLSDSALHWWYSCYEM